MKTLIISVIALFAVAAFAEEGAAPTTGAESTPPAVKAEKPAKKAKKAKKAKNEKKDAAKTETK